ncbi:MAG: hydroxymethylbilane synthase [Phototrophicales bacterium]|nr:MAG: hydroxymethylbilane synthase [Phototrophicales bacterium]
MTSAIRVGTRRSRLALWQTEHVIEQLHLHDPHLLIEKVVINTQGDATLHSPLYQIGGKGLFTAELDDAILNKRVDLAVHSLKDLPTEEHENIGILAVLERHDPHDVLITRHKCTLDDLPIGAVVGTSSRRRVAQLLHYRPDLNVISIRGNVDTRIRKALDPSSGYDAIVVALAGVERLGLQSTIAQILPFEIMLPAPAQGVIAIQGLKHSSIKNLVQSINHLKTELAIAAERAFLSVLGGGCSLPVAAYAHWLSANELVLQARILSPDGKKRIDLKESCTLSEDHSENITLASELGRSVAVVAKDQGAAKLLNAVVVRHSTSPLNGKKIVITRAKHQSRELIDLLQQRGALPLLYPCIDVMPPSDTSDLDQALSRLQQYDWLLITSRNTVLALQRRLQVLGVDLKKVEIQVGAVGPATAELFSQIFKFDVTLIPETHTGIGMCEALQPKAGQRFLLPQSAIARDALADCLRQHGGYVEVVIAYQISVGEGGISLSAYLEDDAVDAIIFTSPSTIKNCLKRLEREKGNRDLLEKLPCAVMGPTTAQCAYSYYFSTILEPQESSLNALVELLEAYFSYTV